MIKSFLANAPQEILDDLKLRIKNTRWTDEITDSGWSYGANLSYMKELADYWLDTFDWRKVESEINSYPNFIADINGHKIHFLHIKGKGRKSIPLIITHGWPGSFLEMMQLIPLLTKDEEFSFDLIIPSIPGFGFSQKVDVPGCNLWFIAELWFKLIIYLGYKKVFLQGGDFGAGISTALALRHPEILQGVHLNYIPGSYAPFVDEQQKLSVEEIKFQKDANHWYEREGAYAHLHKTKPLTAAYGLTDSPIGLCSWIVEKFYAWSDCNGNIESVFSKDELLANVSLYWFTQTIHSSMRLYYENSKAPLQFLKGDFIPTPVGIARFHKEEPFPPRRYIERGYNIQHWSEFNKGGHFATMERPEELAKDIRAFTVATINTNA